MRSILITRNKLKVMFRAAIKRLPGFRQIIHLAFRAESWWFDAWHNVNTREDHHGNRDYTVNFRYIPTRPGRVRMIFRDLPIKNYADYSFVDFGSGKGRILLIAAELPFQTVQGIELRKDLHDLALENLQRYRHFKVRCGGIKCLNMDATDYTFPEENLVLYFFNPFGREVMQKIMAVLDASLEDHPRDVILAMYNPEYAFLVDSMSHLQVFKETTGHRLYRTRSAVQA